MSVDHGEVVREERVEPTDVVVEEPVNRVVQPATRVVEEPSTTYVRRRDPVGHTMAASTLIQTLVWSAVVLILVVVGILVLVRYNII